MALSAAYERSNSGHVTDTSTRPSMTTEDVCAAREIEKSLQFKTGLPNAKRHPGRPSMDILVRSCQDLGKILAKILPRYCQKLQDVMVRSYQESHVPKKNFIAKSYLARKKSERKSTEINIFADLYC